MTDKEKIEKLERLKPFWAAVAGICWHNFVKYTVIEIEEKPFKHTVGRDGGYWCDICKSIFIGNEQFNPYAAHEDRTELTLEVRMSIERQWPGMWREYCEFVYCDIDFNDIDYFYAEVLQGQLDPLNLYNFLQTNKDMWGWSECDNPDCVDGKVLDLTSIIDCHICEGTGKIKHPALIIMEEIENG